MEKILVTGGCGFIGSNFIRLLLQKDLPWDIVNFDLLTYAGNLANLKDWQNHPRLKFFKGDIADRQAVDQVFSQGITRVVHFAAESHVDRSILDSGPFIRTNVVGTQVLLDSARSHKVTKFVHVSTDEVYGSLGDSGFFTEETPLAPNSPYSASKAASDLIVRSYVHTFHFPAVITRCSNNYGPYQFPEKLIPLFISNLCRNEPVPVYGDGLNVRDWIHVEDHCKGILAVLEKGQPGEVYNLGGKSERTNMELTKALLQSLGKPDSLIRYVKDRPGHDRRYAIDCSKAEKELGWQPQWVFENGLQETVRWYLDNPEWVNSIRTGDYLRYYQTQYGNS
ncbi:MAG: dTDP-glucose 4,6-dehydratase [Gemmataceae bacterium]|nr:dTDP-glucose 4,6-dehydratase [Gemmataceae bacterium]